MDNTATINGRVPNLFTVRAGERIRLRLINVANARTFGLKFEGHTTRIAAMDGQPAIPHKPPGGMIVLTAAQSSDFVLDASYRRKAYKLVEPDYVRNRAEAR